MGIKVVAVDWWDEQYFNDQLVEEIQMSSDIEFNKEFCPIRDKRIAGIKIGNLVQLNNGKQTLVRKHYSVTDKYGCFTFETRNIEICNNIKLAFEQNSKMRVMTIFGLDHKYYLDDCITNTQEKLVHAPEWNSDNFFNINKKTKSLILKNLLGSKLLLKSRLESGYYSQILHKHFKMKLPQFDQWIITVENNL